jgi:1-acyl-sn-glycerol-3-phosphate acyltransferase
MLRPLRAARDAARTAVGVIVVASLTIVLGTYVIALASVSPNSPQIRPIMRLWALVFMKMAGVRWQVEGTERVDPSRSYVFVGNHISNLDPPFHIAILSGLPVSVRFLAKAELFRIPILAQAMRRIGIVETDRTAHSTAAHRSINEQVAVAVERGLSLVIYPEGTRSRDAELKPFKKGAFRIAIDNRLPVVPVTICGLDRAWPPGEKLVRGGRARMVLRDPIETQDLTSADIEALRDRVRAIVSDDYQRIRG